MRINLTKLSDSEKGTSDKNKAKFSEEQARRELLSELSRRYDQRAYIAVTLREYTQFIDYALTPTIKKVYRDNDWEQPVTYKGIPLKVQEVSDEPEGS